MALRFIAICLPKSPLPLWKKLTENPGVSSSADTLIIVQLDEDHLPRKPSQRSRDTAEATACRIVSSLRTVRHLSFDTEFGAVLDCMSEDCKLEVRNLHVKLTEKVFRQITLIQFQNLETLVLDADGCQSVDTSNIVGRPSFDKLVTLKIFNCYKHFDINSLIQSCE